VEGEGAKVPVTVVSTVIVGVGIVDAVVFGGLLVGVDVIDIVDLVVEVEVNDEVVVGCVKVDSVEVVIVNVVLVDVFFGFAIVVNKDMKLVDVEVVVFLVLTLVSVVSVSIVVFGVRFS